MSRAADALHLTQPALSRSIAALEQDLDLRLFERSRSGISLTPIGELFLPEAKSLIQTAENLKENLQRYKNGEGGRVSIGMVPQLASIFLSRVATQMMSSKPNLNFHTSIKPHDELWQELKENSIEVVFCTRNQARRLHNLLIAPVFLGEAALYVRSGHPMAKKKRIRPSDLAKYPTLSDGPLAEYLKFSSSQGNFVCSNAHILRDVVLNTDGILVANSALVQNEEASGTVTRLDVSKEIQFGPVETVMVRYKDRDLSPATKVVVDQIASLAQGYGGT